MAGCCNCACEAPRQRPAAGEPQSTQWLKLGIAILLSGLTMYLSLGANLGDPEGLARIVIHGALIAVSAGVMFGLGWPMFHSGWRDLRAGRITLEHAFLIGVVGSFGASVYSSISGSGAIYYEVVVILTAIYLFGRNITERQIGKQVALAQAVPGLRQTASVVEQGKVTEIPVVEILAGQVVRVLEGETIPVDGVIETGRAYIEQQAHTGETYPKLGEKGHLVLAGSLVLDGEITVTATSDGNAREIDRLLKSLVSEGAPVIKAEALAQKVLVVFVPLVLTIALLTGVIWTLLGYPREGWLNALTVTVVACPCALGVAIPLAARRGRMELGLLGIVPTQGDFVDRLAEVDFVAFDKTGTLSDPKLELSSFEVLPDAPPHLRDWIIAVQRQSTHPVARPFWKLQGGSGALIEEAEIETIPGRGIRATFSDGGQPRSIVIGNGKRLADLSIPNPSSDQERNFFVIHENRIVGIAHLEESARESSVGTLHALAEQGFEAAILTGDSTVPDEYRMSGLEVKAGLASNEKADWISAKNSARRVLYIGDGLNDCEGFQQAHASIALESGNSAARTVAQAVLLHHDLSVIPLALSQMRELRKRLVNILKFSFAFNAIGISMAAAGLLHPVLAAVLMFASSIFVITRLQQTRVGSQGPGNSKVPLETFAAPL